MRAFLSYASERREVAERTAIGLRNEGHEVFFASDDLPPGESYDDRIRGAIRRSHMFVFLASRESLEEGAYSLTELAIARRQWPTPAGRVLPVIIDETPIEALPPYLRAVTVVPEGDVVAEVLDAVARQAGERRARRLRSLSWAAGLLILLLAVALVLPRGLQSIENVRVRRANAGDQFAFEVTLRNRGSDRITTVDVGPETDREDVTLGGGNEWFVLHPGEARHVTLAFTLNAPTDPPSFKWRICWGFVPTADLDLKPREIDIEVFFSRYRQEICDRWRPWAPET